MKAQTQRQLRQLHHYLGVFFAPAIIFFALTGAFQVFRLQEDKGWAKIAAGAPPAVLVWGAAIHRDSGPPKVKPARPPEAKGAAARPAAPMTPQKSKLPLQVFTVVMSLGLVFSSLLGIVIALNNRHMRRGSIVMLIAGSILPILLV